LTYRSDDDALRARIIDAQRALGEAEAAVTARADELARCKALKADLDVAIPRRSGLALDSRGYARLSLLMGTAAALGVVGEMVRGYSFWASIGVILAGSIVMIAIAERNNRRKKQIAPILKEHDERMTREAAARASARARVHLAEENVGGDIDEESVEARAARREGS
jgi:Flp pilus assembly protein TadB